jgi:hypothetical protein
MGNEAGHALAVQGNALIHGAAGVGQRVLLRLVVLEGPAAAATISLRCKAVPDGASTFFSWCISVISA